MSYDDNPYYAPEKHGLTIVGELELRESNYSFDTLVAWKNEAGIWLGTDSGCSCPSPFENYSGTADMTGPLTAEQAAEEVRNLAFVEEYDYSAQETKKSVYDPEGLETLVKAVSA